jgi:hypothetical protein
VSAAPVHLAALGRGKIPDRFDLETLKAHLAAYERGTCGLGP